MQNSNQNKKINEDAAKDVLDEAVNANNKQVSEDDNVQVSEGDDVYQYSDQKVVHFDGNELPYTNAANLEPQHVKVSPINSSTLSENISDVSYDESSISNAGNIQSPTEEQAPVVDETSASSPQADASEAGIDKSEESPNSNDDRTDLNKEVNAGDSGISDSSHETGSPASGPSSNEDSSDADRNEDHVKSPQESLASVSYASGTTVSNSANSVANSNVQSPTEEQSAVVNETISSASASNTQAGASSLQADASSPQADASETGVSKSKGAKFIDGVKNKKVLIITMGVSFVVSVAMLVTFFLLSNRNFTYTPKPVVLGLGLAAAAVFVIAFSLYITILIERYCDKRNANKKVVSNDSNQPIQESDATSVNSSEVDKRLSTTLNSSDGNKKSDSDKENASSAVAKQQQVVSTQVHAYQPIDSKDNVTVEDLPETEEEAKLDEPDNLGVLVQSVANVPETVVCNS